MKKISLTCGDPNGIGLEVTAKALESLGPQKGVLFFLFRSANSELKQLKRIDRHFQRIQVDSLPDALSLAKDFKSSRFILDIESHEPAPFWVETAATACSKKILDGLVTAPLSKTLIQSCGFKAKGHTEILQNVSGIKKVNMVFVGKHFSVLLGTGHIPLSQVSTRFNSQELSRTLKQAVRFRRLLRPNDRKKPIAVLGLNPHAGEGGLIGTEEKHFFHKVLQDFPQAVGPIAPDIAFLKKNWKLYSLYVACYHDQGLIPFKMIHGSESGYHLTFGLPFIRTSVDHGTAFDIFGKNKADGSSMKDAILACIRLLR